MRVIDGHVFLGRTLYVNQDKESIIANMERIGIDVSVVVAPPPGPFYDEANRYVYETAQRYPGKLLPLYRANPHLEGEDERVRAAFEKEGFIGLQLDPTNDGYGTVNPIVDPVIQVADVFERPVYIHSGDSIFCPPEGVADLASKFKNVNFVTQMSLRAPRASKGCENLFLMTRPFPTLAFQRGYTEDFDLERLIFATDSPFGSPEIEMKRVEFAGLEYEVKEKILGGNLQRIIRLS